MFSLPFIGPPRSVCSVSWPGGTPCFMTASSNNGRNSVALYPLRTSDHAAKAEDVEDQQSRSRTTVISISLADVLATKLAFRRSPGFPDKPIAAAGGVRGLRRSDRAGDTWCGSSRIVGLIEQGGVDLGRAWSANGARGSRSSTVRRCGRPGPAGFEADDRRRRGRRARRRCTLARET